MINADMRAYNYYLYGNDNGYGQPQISDTVQGALKMAINITSQSIQENILYNGAQYVGITHAYIDDKYVIQYGDRKLKVLYVNPKGRFKQVFMAEI